MLITLLLECGGVDEKTHRGSGVLSRDNELLIGRVEGLLQVRVIPVARQSASRHATTSYNKRSQRLQQVPRGQTQ